MEYLCPHPFSKSFRWAYFFIQGCGQAVPRGAGAARAQLPGGQVRLQAHSAGINCSCLHLNYFLPLLVDITG